MKTILITTSYIGYSNSSTFSIYTDSDSYVTPIETGITQTQLNIGYTTSLVPDNATRIKLYSNSYCGYQPIDGQLINFVPVPTNGLLFYYDPGVISSYPGSGSILYDLSGNNRNATIGSGITYSSSSGGSFVLPGTDGVCITGTTLNQTYTSWSMVEAVKMNNNGYYVGFMYSRISGGSANGIGTFANTRRLDLTANNTTEYTAPSTPTTSLVPTGSWAIVAGTVSSTTYSRQIYRTSGSVAVQNYTSGTKTAGSSNFSAPILLGNDSDADRNRTLNGSIGISMMYNRQLSQAELTTINSYFKTRYGI